MANNYIKERHFFALHEYEKEEEFLREQSKKGLALTKISGIGVYTFEEIEPEDVVYRLDFKQLKKDEMESYIQMYYDYGWEYVLSYNDYHYFRKSAQFHTEEDLAIFSDDASRAEMAAEVIHKKLFPMILVVVMSCIIFTLDMTQFFDTLHIARMIFGAFWLVILIIDVIQIIRCGKCLNYLKNKYSRNEI